MVQNDNFKGVSTLFGSGTTNFKSALNWGTITTLAGCIFAVFIAQGLMKNFSGKGLIPDEALKDPSLAIAVALGAASTVFLATKIGIPISTTHAIVGALVGAGFVSVGNALNLKSTRRSISKTTFVKSIYCLCISNYSIYHIQAIKIIIENRQTNTSRG
jgi:PiT family inorganic phosphate transporter